MRPRYSSVAVRQASAPGRRSGRAGAAVGRTGSATKRSRGQLGPVQVAARDAGAADVHLAGDADGHRLPVCVERRRPAGRGCGAPMTLDQRRVQIGLRSGAVGDVHRRLGDAVHVDELRLPVAVARPTRAEDRRGRAPRRRRSRSAAERLRRRCRSSARARAGGRPSGVWLSTVTPLAAEQVVERLAASGSPRTARSTSAAAVEQRAPDLPDGEVERVGVEQRPHVALVEAEPRVGRRRTGARRCDARPSRPWAGRSSPRCR